MLALRERKNQDPNYKAFLHPLRLPVKRSVADSLHNWRKISIALIATREGVFSYRQAFLKCIHP
jgi:hypothetical protein